MKAFQWEYTELDIAAVNRLLEVFSDNPTFTQAQRNILKQFPLVYHGYVSPDKKLQKYFSKASWYVPDPAYNPESIILTDKEKEWMKYWE